MNNEFFFSQAQKSKTKTKTTTQRKLEISNYKLILQVISNFTVFILHACYM